MTSTLATIADQRGYGPDEIIRASFLASYREPTRGHYAMAIDQWYTWCASKGLRPSEAKRAHIELWARWLEEDRGLMLSSISGKLTAVCGLYRFAQMDGYLETNEAQFVRRPPVSQISTTESLTRSELLAILNTAESADVQDHAVLCVLGYNGLRVGELCSLQVTDVGERRAQPVLKVVREKEFDPDLIPMVPRTARAVRLWIGNRRGGPLFLLRREVPMDRRGVDRICKRIAKKAGITKRIHPHVFRHTFIELGLDAGAEMRDMQHSVGHRDIRSISRYDRARNRVERNSAHWVALSVESA